MSLRREIAPEVVCYSAELLHMKEENVVCVIAKIPFLILSFHVNGARNAALDIFDATACSFA